MRRMALSLMLAMATGGAQAAMVVKTVDYRIGDDDFQGQLIYDDASSTLRPGLLMVPAWYGPDAAAIEKAKSIAGHDYVIFLADMYGSKIRPRSNEAASAAVKPLYDDRELMRTRVKAALQQLRAQRGSAPLDVSRLAAIGFCFGGSAVLDLARSGADIAAVITFHGNLSTDDPALAKQIKARVLVLNGADDRGVAAQVAGFEDEMRATTVDWQFVNFGGAVHCFTEVGQDSPGCRYDAKVARRAYRMMRDWLGDAFAGR
ncbi:MAG: dienelactone hydrolase family protein [Dokdonella sp.]